MSKLLSLSTVLIAVLLLGEAVFDRVLPIIVLEINTHRYEQLVSACNQARREWTVFAQGVTGDKQTDGELRHAMRTELLSCLHEESLKNKLVRWGVSPASIRATELNVISRDPGLRYDFTDASRS
jgi:hypothetical protein